MAGGGFHSNNARGITTRVEPSDPTVVTQRVTPLVRIWGYEVGFRTGIVCRSYRQRYPFGSYMLILNYYLLVMPVVRWRVVQVCEEALSSPIIGGLLAGLSSMLIFPFPVPDSVAMTLWVIIFRARCNVLRQLVFLSIVIIGLVVYAYAILDPDH